MMAERTTLLPITMANGIAATLGALVLWIVWRLRWRREIVTGQKAVENLVKKELQWFAILPLGMATILNQAFHNFNTILLGAMSTTAEVGRYNSAYRILFLILGAYWLVTNSLFPRLSRAKAGVEFQRLVWYTVAAVALAGILISIVIGVFAPSILKVIYGSDLGSASLLRVLIWAIPMDFCIALLGTVFVSRGLDRTVLVATGTAAALNIVLNLALIPKFSGMGAAIATLVSYVYLLGFLIQKIRKPIFVGAAATPANAM
jgi:O-antigen/teichoic acid export membrane protein